MTHVQDSVQTPEQMLAALRYTDLAKQAIAAEILANQPKWTGRFSRLFGKIGFK